MTMASEYFRLTGDFANAVTCLQRAIYYSPRYTSIHITTKTTAYYEFCIFVWINLKKKTKSMHKNVPRLYLSNMLHKLEYINESLSIMLSNIAENMDNSLFAYYIGNVYSVCFHLECIQMYFFFINNLCL